MYLRPDSWFSVVLSARATSCRAGTGMVAADASQTERSDVRIVADFIVFAAPGKPRVGLDRSTSGVVLI